MNIKQRNIIKDWMDAEQRMAGHNPKRYDWLITLTQGVICLGLVMVMLFFVWQMTTPAGIEEMANIAAYIGSLIWH